MNISAVFLDREGVITPKLEDGEYLLNPENVSLSDDIIQGLRQLNESDIPLFIVSNQSCVHRNMITLEKALAIHEIVLQLLAEHGIAIRDSRICPHVDVDECNCRKPKPGMILDLCTTYGINPTRTVMIGDSITDIQAGERSKGALQIYIGEPRSDLGDALCVPTVDMAIQEILRHTS